MAFKIKIKIKIKKIINTVLTLKMRRIELLSVMTTNSSDTLGGVSTI